MNIMNFEDILIKMFFNYNCNTKNKEELSNSFKLPIEYNINKKELTNNIKNDLELLEYKREKNLKEEKNLKIIKNNEYNENLYYCLLNPNNNYERKIINKWAIYYTNDINYLEDTQYLIKNIKSTINFDLKDEIEIENVLINNEDSLLINCEEIFYDNNFVDIYDYINLPYLDKYNNNDIVMEAFSIYNLSSPLFSLLIPIISLILPFFIIKLQGYNISIQLYFEHLKYMFNNHIIGELFSNFSNSNITTKIYLILSIGLYIFQIYNNFISCIKYFKNMKYIHKIIFTLKEYIENSIKNLNNLLKYTKNLITYSKFNLSIEYNIDILKNYNNFLQKISPYKFNFQKLTELGILMKTFYKLNNDEKLIQSIYFVYDCNGYIKNLLAIQKHIKENNMNYCKFIKNDEDKTSFKNAYFGNLLEKRDKLDKIVKNSYKLNNNLILTGPNAAGKTTLLKSTLFNIILSQQIGCGFYEDASIKLYDYIHCYINIPDTSNRDSLFQAEARQCKNILEIINNNKDKTHFCVFDELYSGTNPEEAIKSAYGYLKYLNSNPKINYILTTHYYKLCYKLEKKDIEINKNAENYHMLIKKDFNTNDFKFCYKIKKGISKIKGGIKILKDMNYPEDILNSI